MLLTAIWHSPLLVARRFDTSLSTARSSAYNSNRLQPVQSSYEITVSAIRRGSGRHEQRTAFLTLVAICHRLSATRGNWCIAFVTSVADNLGSLGFPCTPHLPSFLEKLWAVDHGCSIHAHSPCPDMFEEQTFSPRSSNRRLIPGLLLFTDCASGDCPRETTTAALPYSTGSDNIPLTLDLFSTLPLSRPF